MEDTPVTDSRSVVIENDFRRRSVFPGRELYLERPDAVDLIRAYERAAMAAARVEGFLIRSDGLYGSTAMIADYRPPKSDESFEDYVFICNRFAIDSVLNMVVSGDLALFRQADVARVQVGTMVFAVLALTKEEITRPPIELD